MMSTPREYGFIVAEEVKRMKEHDGCFIVWIRGERGNPHWEHTELNNEWLAHEVYMRAVIRGVPEVLLMEMLKQSRQL